MGTKAYLVGAADAAISLLAQIDDKDFIDELFLKAAQNPQKTGRGMTLARCSPAFSVIEKKKPPLPNRRGIFLQASAGGSQGFSTCAYTVERNVLPSFFPCCSPLP
jgi:hypothetical protein